MDQQEDTQAQSDSIAGWTIAGKYRVGAKLGTGGMGSVYRATRLMIGDEVAIKILSSNQTDPRAGERFQREARAAARLKHPNVVAIHDFGTTEEGLQYLVMELVEGDSLRRLIKQQGVIAPATAVEIIRQVCEALDDAHQHNVIHRDIKPDNIIVRSTANGWRVKVLDFGIAKLRDDIAGNLTQTGSIVGTPHYMSPEQCLGEELDSQSDIYSLGVVVYEMLTGLVPFNSSTSSAVVIQHVTQSPPPLRAVNPTISAALECAVLYALEKQRALRPQSASEFAAALSSALVDNSHALQPKTVISSAILKPVANNNPASIVNTEGRGSKHPFVYVAIGLVSLAVAAVLVALIMTRKQSDSPKETATEVAASPSPKQIATLDEVNIRNLVARWITAQNAKNFADYQSCYGVPFEGIKRTKSGRAYSYDFNGWMKDRWRMISVAVGLTLEVKNLRIRIEGDSAIVEFDQFYRSVRYSDWGPKLLKVKLLPSGERIVYEELIASYPL